MRAPHQKTTEIKEVKKGKGAKILENGFSI